MLDLAARRTDALLAYFREGGPEQYGRRWCGGWRRWPAVRRGAKLRSRCPRRGFTSGSDRIAKRVPLWLAGHLPLGEEGPSSPPAFPAEGGAEVAPRREGRRPSRPESEPAPQGRASAARPHPLLPLHAAGRRRRADRRAVRGAASKGHRARPDLRRQPEGSRIRAAFVEAALRDSKPAAIVTATAFAAGAEPGAETLFDRAGVPVLQVIVATTRREAWEKSQRGLAPADLAMHVVMPELDGRILAGALSFKARKRNRSGAWLPRLRQPAGTGPRRAGGRPHRRVPAPAADAAREAPAGDPDSRLSGGARAAPAMRSGWTCRRACSPCCMT